MRSKIAAVLVGAAFLLAGAPMALAKTDQHQFSGGVTRLDAAAKTLAVKEQGGKTGKEMTFTLAPEAKIMQGSKATSLGALKVGEQVRVTYADQGSTHQAQRIEVLPAQTAKAGTSKTPATAKPKPKSGY